MKKNISLVLLFIIVGLRVFSQAPPKPYGPLPTQGQLNWQEMGMYCLIHYGLDTYTNKEWGDGSEDPKLLNPSQFSAMQIVAAAKAGGFKGVVVVAKHHDGFCLWPTKTTDHNISHSPYKNGKGDMLREYREACDKLGMKLGVYCSPWDRNNANYGTPEYVNTYREQLKELYTNYGPLFMSWHDGANGGDGYYGGKREVRKIDRSTYYGWPTTWGITRKLQPNAVIFGDVGPDVRWVGNEEGHAGETSWATYTPHAPDEGKEPANGYVKDYEGTEGTRGGKYWMPAECDVSLRPGWFYHEAQNSGVKSPYTLLDLYYKSVGRGAALDLGLSPDPRGILNEIDVKSLTEFGNLLKQIFAVNMAKGATVTASNVRGSNKAKYGPQFLLDNDRYSYWATDDKVTNPQLVLDMHTPKVFNVIRLRENIKLGQRIDSVAVDAFINNKWQQIATATSIGGNRLIRLTQNVTASKLRLRITGSPVAIALSDFGIYKEPVHLSAPIITRNKNGEVVIGTEAPVNAIHYTLGGSEPTIKSPVYDKPILIGNGKTVKARAFENASLSSEITTHQFGISPKDWTIIDASGTDGDGKRAENAIDEISKSFFSTLKHNQDTIAFPQQITVDMGKVQEIKAFSYLPRQDKQAEGTVDRYNYYISNDGKDWTKAASGEFSNIKSNPIEQMVTLPQVVNARYFRFEAVHVIAGNGITVAELSVY
ncbi:alpha-L-fucosidase [Mucilaginibacter sabulilitoris]|uniref:alpha-L-fucosidase n=1 Tax=Mucilaginibacter sabulilitoris TaxID=1173583 RepID=A0ABZ0TFJ9_9SPHI|nr:alpha-L-fucosidase [Mucilaginibacter sabulilitoris]WPU91038.1 alpha-L-fucosidase [Mucilaginibacter sabulilitoris]